MELENPIQTPKEKLYKLIETALDPISGGVTGVNSATTIGPHAIKMGGRVFDSLYNRQAINSTIMDLLKTKSAIPPNSSIEVLADAAKSGKAFAPQVDIANAMSLKNGFNREKIADVVNDLASYFTALKFDPFKSGK